MSFSIESTSGRIGRLYRSPSGLSGHSSDTTFSPGPAMTSGEIPGLRGFHGKIHEHHFMKGSSNRLPWVLLYERGGWPALLPDYSGGCCSLSEPPSPPARTLKANSKHIKTLYYNHYMFHHTCDAFGDQMCLIVCCRDLSKTSGYGRWFTNVEYP